MNKIVEKINNDKKLTLKELSKFRAFLSEKHISYDLFDFQELRMGNFIKIKDRNKFNFIFDKYLQKKSINNKRVLSANIGNSHNSKCSQGILIYKEKNNDEYNNTFIFLPDKNKIISKEYALIIENLETFLDDKFISSLQNIPDLNNIQIIFGSGNEITNSYYKDYLKQFKGVFCLFDWDKQGFSFFRNLVSNHVIAHWYVENIFFDKAKNMKTVRKELSRKELSDILSQPQSSDSNFNRTIQFIRDYKITIEQEIFQ